MSRIYNRNWIAKNYTERYQTPNKKKKRIRRDNNMRTFYDIEEDVN